MMRNTIQHARENYKVLLVACILLPLVFFTIGYLHFGFTFLFFSEKEVEDIYFGLSYQNCQILSGIWGLIIYSILLLRARNT